MRFEKYLALKNLRKKGTRTAALLMLTTFLSFSVFSGAVVVRSLQKGLQSYTARLGADVVVVPNEARSKGTLDGILMQGIPGYFYMDAALLEKIRAIPGVETASPQFFLASASAGCCSAKVQIIGFEPESDFSIQPWIRRSYSGELRDGDVIAGASINLPVNGKLSFYKTACRVAAQLEETGTGLDSAIYANMNTIRLMMENAQKLGFRNFDRINARKSISSVMIKVKEGWSSEEVAGDINIHLRRVDATAAKNMIANISGGLVNVSRIIGFLIVLVWILALLILFIAFSMIANERSREFAILRMLGSSECMLNRLLRLESVFLGMGGALCGIALGALFVLPFGRILRQSLELPYLLPDFVQILCMGLGTLILSILAAALTSRFSSRRICRRESALLFREDS